MTHAQMMNMMSASELIYWQAYSSIEPFGEWRADLRAGTIAAAIYMNNPNRKKGSKKFKPQDFMPVFWKPVKNRPTLEGLALKLEQMKRILTRK